MKQTNLENYLVLVFGAIFLLSIIMLFSQGFTTTGYATSADTTSNVTISTYFAVQMSENLTDGIQFGNISELPATNVNATHNNDSNGQNTTFWMNVSADSNSAVDFCLKGYSGLETGGGDVITIENETYHNHSNTSATTPDVTSEVSFTTSYVNAGPNVTAGSLVYYRFWLDVPEATASGTYNNSVSFKGVVHGGSC